MSAVARAVCLTLLAGPLLGCAGPDPTAEPDLPASTASTPADAAPSDGQSDAQPPSPSASTTSAGPESPAPGRKGRVVAAGGSQFGKVLFDGTGQAVYLFDLETSTKPRCYDACAEAWPPVLTKGKPRAGRGVDQALLGTTRRADGRRQVTYAGRPLYFYAHEGTDEVRCHNVPGFGGLWLAVTPDGTPAP